MAALSYNIEYRKGIENVAADAFTRAHCASIQPSKLKTLHDYLRHPGVALLLHQVRKNNLPFSTEEVKSVC